MHAASTRPGPAGRPSSPRALRTRLDRPPDGAALDIERRHLILFSGSAHEELALRIADELNLCLGSVERLRREDGEVYVRYEESVRGADVFLVQSCAPPTNDHLVELLVMAHAARFASARTVTAVIPWYPYARQDKVDLVGEPLSARLVSDLLGAAGVGRVVTVDLHVSQIEGFARYPVDHISAVPLLAARVAAIPHIDGELVIVSPDTGRIDTAREVAGLLDASVALITKERPVQQAARVTGLVGDVDGKTCLLIDDMIDTAGTLCAAGQAVRDHGASRVWACATHAVLSPPACERLAASVFERIVVTDTLPVDPAQMPPNLEVVSVGGQLAATIRAIAREQSMSALPATSSV
jgi:ribose-phosphate pyrophosphokinase